MTIQEALNILELKDQTIIGRLQSAPNYDIACQVVEDLHCIVRKQRKLLAKKYHPDIGGNEEKFKKINNVCDMLLDIKAQIVQPTPMVIFQSVIIRSNVYESTTSTTTSWW